ncbi:hypothetical protein Peur_037912 [Populus x canadensis]|jgi:heterogeneous nuclear ribonucleoprotein A1/A3
MQMDPTKKRKLEENGIVSSTTDLDSPYKLTPQDARKMMERFTPDQLLDILQNAVVRHPDILDAVRSVADPDATQRKLFIRGLGWETTTENLRNLFSTYGELEEAVVILDKNTGKSKGYGFVIYKHVDGALLALKEPSKKIDGRVTVTQLAIAGNSGANNNNNSSANPGVVDVAMRKIYVANVPYEMPSDKLLNHFAQYGEIEEGPLGFDKQTGKSKGFALFVYKTAEGAQAALLEPVKMIEGRQLNCKLAIDGKRGRQPGGGQGPGQDGLQGQVQGGNVHGDSGMGMVLQTGYGAPGGYGSYGGAFSSGVPPMGGHQQQHHHPAAPLNASLGGPGLGSQGVGGLSGTGGGSYGPPYGGYGGPGSTGYGGLGGGGAGVGASVGASSSFRLPPSSVGMPTGGYPDPGQYSLSSSNASFPSQHQGASPAPRVPSGGMYPNLPPYY